MSLTTQTERLVKARQSLLLRVTMFPKSCFSNFFNCEQCGNIQFCHHKWDIAQNVWYKPYDNRTANELRTVDKQQREEVWSDLIAVKSSKSKSKASHYKKKEENMLNTGEAGDDGIESLEFIQTSLQQLQDSLQRYIKNSNKKTVYEQVLQTSPTYVQDESFLIMFLRSERYDIKATTKRIIGHFELKQELFGGGGTTDGDLDLELLGRDLTVEDLTPKEQKRLNDGNSVRFLPHPDHAGRPILFDRPSLVNFDYPESEVCIWTSPACPARVMWQLNVCIIVLLA